MAVSARRGAPLTPEEIHSTALRLVEEGGVEALSMRKLAAVLDVNPMSLYHHVANKTALISQICQTMAGRLALPDNPGSPWQERLRDLAHAYRRMVQRYPSLWAYIHTHPEAVGDHQGGIWDVLFPILADAGVPEEERTTTADVLHGFVAGLVVTERQGHIGRDDPAQADRVYETAIDMIIRGLPHP
ncbi:TetR/AcrR family transcriptional regulator C-terminal domain-containing protein [Nonomuraea sp. SMC257]|uniref:TetR/AcrR family transcriptional regulator C-terminal domain-containing protein n=1 Tax=Nonomuraea montanisoli TaxID=2741721 RepID=A0A7Y6I9E0_9ACTN|nr:TetR/AcrR family transcriptional regulator C-terminal domain-containing protein [Nonomuraea montanisoli]NUW34117.1 TetR/AcrR family transcriptional regulator C-terminal domain-containing protein [Nonomuraea montanisoli]